MTNDITRYNKKFRIRTGDKVIVITGRFKNQVGTVLTIDKKNDRVAIEGVAVRTKYVRAQQGQEKQQKTFHSLIHISNVAIQDPDTGKATKVKYEMRDGKKIRIAKGSGKVV